MAAELVNKLDLVISGLRDLREKLATSDVALGLHRRLAMVDDSALVAVVVTPPDDQSCRFEVSAAVAQQLLERVLEAQVGDVPGLGVAELRTLGTDVLNTIEQSLK